MKRITQIIAAAAFALSLQCGSLFAQPGGGGGGGQMPDFANMNADDMLKMVQQRQMENLREQLAITNNDEWSLIEKRLSKVSELRMNSLMGAGAGMMGGMGGMGGRGGRGGGPGGPGGGMDAGGPGGGRGGFGNMFPTDPNVEALQKVIDGNGTAAQIKAAVEKLRDARKKKQEELTKAQASLREVLTARQEAILIINGMLE